MASILTIPKVYSGHVERIQTNAVASWRRLKGENEMILFSDDSRATQVAAPDALRRVSGITRQRARHAADKRRLRMRPAHHSRPIQLLGK